MKNLLYHSILVLMVLATTFAAVATPVSAEAPAPDQGTAEYEIRFMEDMIDHHAMAVMMSGMCLMKAVHPELIATCNDILATQSQEMKVMHMWLHHWYGIFHVPDMMHGMHHQMMDGMHNQMMLDPHQFEAWFLQSMISHHLAAIEEAEGCTEKAHHDELIGLCQNIVDAQSQEIDTMKTWQQEWFGS